MKYLAAYLLVSLSGKTPSAADVTKVLTSVGVEVDAARVETVCKELEGKDVNALIAAGKGKIGSFAAAAAPAAAASTGAAPAAAAKKEEKKVEEKKEESDEDMGMGLFD